ncbi:MAG: VanW family protein [Patescibacteria group bacterium]
MDTIYPGVYVHDEHIGGLSLKQAEAKLHAKFDELKLQSFVYTYETSTAEIHPTIVSPSDPDLTQEIISWQPEVVAEKAYAQGRNKSWIENLINPLWQRLVSYTIEPGIEIDNQKLRLILEEQFSEYEIPVQEPQVTWSLNKPVVAPGTAGYALDYTEAINLTEQAINRFESVSVTIPGATIEPKVTVRDITDAVKENLTNLGQLRPVVSVKYNYNTWYIPFSEYQTHIELIRTDNDNLSYSINSDWLQERLSPISEVIDIKSQDAKFTVTDGRVVEFQNSKDGVLLDIPASVKTIQTNMANNIFDTDLVVEIDRATIQTSDANDLGIETLLGVGTSDFSGSPQNRRENIRVGADALNGLIIKPDGEFSLIDALLPIDDTNGYLPELVIKGDKTIPEFGGGLCQIGTTTFRAALSSGLDITMRQNHSYRVRYYEPAGTDATIYDPAPDFRFLNDTEGHVLIQTHIEGDILKFEFWGRSDGRIATTTTPNIYNITPPPPTKYIDTTDLEPGEIKCTESAHNGATAEFDYMITYPDGNEHKETFTSYYRPWQEVCLRGVDENASSTEEVIEL